MTNLLSIIALIKFQILIDEPINYNILYINFFDTLIIISSILNIITNKSAVSERSLDSHKYSVSETRSILAAKVCCRCGRQSGFANLTNADRVARAPKPLAFVWGMSAGKPML